MNSVQVLIDELAHFDRERIPERVVHAKGAGAFGYFEVTHDITKYCKVKLNNPPTSWNLSQDLEQIIVTQVLS